LPLSVEDYGMKVEFYGIEKIIAFAKFNETLTKKTIE